MKSYNHYVCTSYLKVQFLIITHLLPLSPTPQHYYIIVYLFWGLSKVVEGNGGIPLHWVINLVNVS